METLERIIAEHPFFVGLDEGFTNLMVSCASNVRFEAGTYILKEGDPANTFYLIREGKVAVEVLAPQHKPIIISTLSVGEILGWSWLVSPFRWKFHARAGRYAKRLSEIAAIGVFICVFFAPPQPRFAFGYAQSDRAKVTLQTSNSF